MYIKLKTRIIAALTGLSVFPILAPMAMSAQSSQTRRPDENIDRFLETFSVIDESLTEDGRITRGEFAHIIKNISERSGTALTTSAEFSDVGADTPYSADIFAAAGTGYMSGFDGMFRPEAVITDTEAAAAMVHMLNCDFIIGYSADYESGVWKAVKDSGIDISRFGGDSNCEWIKKLVYNSLNAYTAVESKVQNGTVYMSVDKSETYLNKYWELFEVKGILEANPFIAVNGGTRTGSNMIVIGGEEYISYLSYENAKYLGAYVNAYVSEAEDTDGQVLCMYPDKNYKEPVVINGRDVDDINNFSNISAFSEEGRRARYAVSPTASVYYNFEYMGPVRAFNSDAPRAKELMSAIEDGSSCEIVLVENTKDGEYDFVWVRVYENYSVTRFTYDGYDISDRYGAELDFEDAFSHNNVVLLDDSGSAADASKLGANDILTVMTLEENGLTEAVFGYVSHNAISGRIATAGKTYVIDNSEYYAARRYLKLMQKNDKRVLTLKSGLTTTFYINRFNEICAVSMADYYREGVSYAFIIRAFYDANEERLILKLLNEDGDIKDTDTAWSVNVNGKKYSSEQAYKTLSALSGEPMSDNGCYVYRPARITSKDNRITAIEAAFSNVRPEGSPLDRMYPDVILYSGGKNTDGSDVALSDVVYKSNTFGKQVGATTATVIFDVPIKQKGGAAVTDYDAYSVTSVSNMVDDCVLGIGGVKRVGASGDGAYMEFYDLDSTLFAAAAVRYYDYDESTGSLAAPPEMQSNAVVVTKVIDAAVNDEGERVMIINGYRGGAEVSLFTAELRDMQNPWSMFTTLTDADYGASLEKADGTIVTPADIAKTGLKPGDIIQVSVNAANEVTNILLNMRAGKAADAAWLRLNGNGTNTSILSSGAGHGNEYLGVNYGEITEVNNGNVVMRELDGKTRVYSIGSPTVTVYDRQIRKARKGGLGDVTIGKDMYIRQYYSQVKEVVVFEN